MSTLSAAITRLIDERHAERLTYDWLDAEELTRDLTILGNAQIRVAYEVGSNLAASLEYYNRETDVDFTVDWGTFSNGREYGLTFTHDSWTFCFYEHRNSDQIHFEGCPTNEVADYGPYGGEDKYDTLGSVDYDEPVGMAEIIARVLSWTTDGKPRNRAALQKAFNTARTIYKETGSLTPRYLQDQNIVTDLLP